MLLFNNCYKTISGLFFAICIFFFHKTEVQTLNLSCLTGLNLNWFISYSLKCSRRQCVSSVNFYKIATDKWSFYDHIWPFLASCMFSFHKTEFQTVILRCLMSLNLNWYKSYDTKRKNSKNTNLWFWTKLQKNGNENISFLCHNLWTNQNLLEFRPVKYVIMTIWTSILWKKNIHFKKMARIGRNTVIYKGTFVSNQSLVPIDYFEKHFKPFIFI